MSSRNILIAGVLIAAVVLAGVVALSTRRSEPEIIPRPRKLSTGRGEFKLGPATTIVVDEQTTVAGQFLAERLRTSTGFELRVQETKNAEASPGAIVLSVEPGEREGYRLAARPGGVTIVGSDAAGAFYGAQTLLQCLPTNAFSTVAVSQQVSWSVPAVEIEDAPRFPWRGLLLDVARHFFTKEEVKKVMDSMATHKLNRLQLHLTDDQGWRVEIKKYPKLTEIGAWRKEIGFGLDPKSSTAYGPDGRYGGFYTQADIRELVAYGQRLNITIVPEIEMPGHASAALSAYPELSCQGGPYSTDTGAGVFAGIYCPAKEKTYDFLKDTLTEVATLFPAEYIHIGGDEVPKDNWKKCAECQALMKREGLKDEAQLQSYFLKRIAAILSGLSRRLIGWSEMREGAGLPPNVILMDWIGGAVESAREGHDVIMTPTTFCYLDYYQSTNHGAEPKAIGGYVPLPKVYSFQPIPQELEPQFRKHILGGQANLWTEYIANLRHVEYMLYPRLCALAEVVWSPEKGRDYQEFTRRLQTHLRRLDLMGVNYRRGIPTEAEAARRTE